MMIDQMEQFVRRRMQTAGSEGPQSRRNTYNLARDAILEMVVQQGGRADLAVIKKSLAAFDAAVERVEAEFALSERLSEVSPRHQAKAAQSLKQLGGLAGAGVVVYPFIDFLSPILNGIAGLSSMAAYLLVGVASLIGSALLMQFAGMAQFRDRLLTGIRGGIAVATIGALALGCSLVIPESKERGLFAAAVPGLAGAQDAMLGRIEQNTREAAEGIKRVESKVEVLKKETSEDPCKELVNIGFLCDDATSQRAVLEGNRRLLELLLAGGQPVSRTGMIMMLQTNFQPVSAELILQYRDLVHPGFCNEDSVDELIAFFTQQSFLADPATKPEAREFFVQLCGREALQQRYTDKLAALKVGLSDIDASMKVYEAEIAACTNEIVSKNQQGVLDADDFDVKLLIEKSWDEGFEYARAKRQADGIEMVMMGFVANERVRVAEQLSVARMMGADLRSELPSVARMGCKFGSSKPEKPSENEIAEVEKVLAGLN